ncbi:SDR family NAD(P)-dependent oxidoreductase [Streptomyces sp. NPDC051546]|uniref:SDR family NAD(P)-dependent oxidoreductase n=1 Tax=Streptomyces sp. NPDC051546 TaxID=3365655 RepID=UPI0037AB64A0
MPVPSPPPSPQVPIAVVGVSALMPGDHGPDGFWNSIVHGRDLIGDVPATHWRPEDYYDPDPAARDRIYAKRGGFLSPVDYPPLFFATPPTTLAATDTAQLLALFAADEVLRDAVRGPLPAALRERTGVVIGAIALEMLHHMSSRTQRPVWRAALRDKGVPDALAEEVCDRITEHYVPWQEASFPGMLSNVVAGRIANRFDLHGMNHTVDAACASSLSALTVAVGELTLGRADLMVTGGVDTLNDITTYMCFGESHTLSPSQDCRPFSDDADGMLLGEGIALFALKRLADAERDGDRVYAVLRGVGTSSDGHGAAVYAPVPQGQARALRRAYEAAGYGPGTVELLEAHGTGTVAGDAAEVAAVRAVFSESGRTDGPWCALGSVKSQVGHTKAAAGAAGLLKAVLALHHRVLPPTLKVRRPNPSLGLDDGPLYLNTALRPWVRDAAHPRRASVSSFGFGGSNFHVTLEEYTGQGNGEGGTGGLRPARYRTAPSELFLVGGGSPEEALGVLAALVDRAAAGSFAEVARGSQQAFDPTSAVRLALVAGAAADLEARAAAVSAAVTAAPGAAFTTPDGSCYAPGAAEPGRVAFLFPGQGSQYPGMGVGIAVHHGLALEVWDELAGLGVGDRPLHEVVFPKPVFTEEERSAQEGLLAATEWAQPALAAQSLALLRILSALGLTPYCVAGHSFGELVALHAAGVLDAGKLLRLARRRGELMRDACTEPAGMLAVTGSADAVARFVEGIGSDGLWTANRNAPDQVVLAGLAGAVEAAARDAEAAGLSVRRLAVSTAPHTPLMEPALGPLRTFLDGLALRSPGLPVYAGADARPYPADADAIREAVAAHPGRPVLFAEQVEAMYADGVRVFVEVGAGSVLTGLAGRVLEGRDVLAVSLDRRGQDGVRALQCALGRLAVAGLALDFGALWSEYDPLPSELERREHAITIEIGGANQGRLRPSRATAPAPRQELTTHHAEAEAGIAVTVDPYGTMSAQAGGQMPLAADGAADWLSVFQEVQRQTGEAHAAYQRTVADTHLAFLRTTEVSLTALSAALSGQGPDHRLPLAAPQPGAVRAAVPAAVSRSVPAPARTAAVVQADAPPVRPAAPAPALSGFSPQPPAPVPAPAERSSSAIAVEVRPQEDEGSLEDTILAVVAELTGYPAAMLGPDMHLESELGVDSIKRVQVLSKLRKQLPDLPAGGSELARLTTVREFADHLRQSASGAPRRSERRKGSSPRSAPDGSEPGSEGDPAPLHRLIVRMTPAVAPGLAAPGLHRHPVHVCGGPEGLADEVAAALRSRGVEATVVVGAAEGARSLVHLGGLATVASEEEADSVVREVFAAARTFGGQPDRDGGVFAVVQDTGGTFGTGPGPEPVSRAPLGGLAALCRTAALEWPDTFVKAVDCAPGDREALVARIAAELCTGGSDPEVGLGSDGVRRVREISACDDPVLPAEGLAPPREPVDEKSVIVVSGGARGVTGLCVRELARAHRPRFVLLGRTGLPREDAELSGARDGAAVRELLLSRPAEGGGAHSPAAVDRQVRAVLAAREAADTVRAVEAAGSSVLYAPVDVCDRAALAQVLDEVRARWGPITGVVHAAGVIQDRLIAEKSDAQFRAVYEPKVEGLRALTEATAGDPLSLLCVFSSVTAWAGNPGQCDYGAANQVMEDMLEGQRLLRPDCRVTSLAWGAWDGGMVDPSLAAHLRGLGVPLISPEAGSRAFVREVARGPASARVLLVPDGTRPELRPALAGGRSGEVMVSAGSVPQLGDHVIAGAPVLPLALMLEWFLRAVGPLAGPGPRELGTVRVLRPVRLDGFPATAYRLLTTLTAPRPSADRARGPWTAELRSPEGILYAEAQLVGGFDPVRALGTGDSAVELPRDAVPLYGEGGLFHGPAFHAVRELRYLDQDGAQSTLCGVRELGWPDELWITDPALVDGALQTGLLWAARVAGLPVLPLGMGGFRLHRAGAAEGPVRCSMRLRERTLEGLVCDLLLTDGDGQPRAELIAVELVARPD